MLDIKLIREKSDFVKKAIESKGYKAPIDEILRLDEERRKMQKQLDDFKAVKNQASKQIAAAKGDEREQKIREMKEVDKKADGVTNELRKINDKLNTLLLNLPNLPALDVKVGKDERENEVLYEVGKPTKFSFKPKDHLELGKLLDIIDTERAAKISGSRFGYLRNQAALLELALVRYAFDKLVNRRKNKFARGAIRQALTGRPLLAGLGQGFKPIIPPVMVKAASLRDSGHLMPGEEQERYFYPQDDLYLVGTSEQSVVPMHKDEVFEEKQLPLRYVAFSTCFRREAGSHGQDVKGILRVHQFDKVEMVSFTRPEDSDKEHKLMLALEEEIMKDLRLPYRVVKMCTGDLGATAARKYDIEAYLPSQNTYRETHSTSTCTDFQARRLNIRMRRKGKMEFVHTLNGTVIAVGRMLVAILENYQKKDGSVEIPKVLQKYCRFKKITSQ